MKKEELGQVVAVIEHPRHDFYVDTFDMTEGKHWLYAEANPERKFEVTDLLDSTGEPTDDPETAENQEKRKCETI